MTGLDRAQGAALSGIDHLKQSIRDILTTPVGSRVMRREYGSTLPGIVDRPVDGNFAMEVFAATAGAILRWEPRLDLESVQLLSAEPGAVEVALVGAYLPDGTPVTVGVPL